MKVRAVIKLIEEDGWFIVRTKGSHRQFKHETKPGLVTIAGKPSDELAPGTLNSVLRGGPEMRYLVIIEKTKTGFSAFSPDLPGCVATGSTREETEKNMRDAITFHLEGMRQEGLKSPEPQSISTYLDVPV